MFTRRWVEFGCLVGSFLLALCCARFAHADEASGTWTGEVEGRGNYFYERSTRVMIPTGRIAIEAPNGVRANVSSLVDAITSASIGQGATQDSLFTEIRYGVTAGLGKTFDLVDGELDLNAYAVYSTEPDYKSWIGGVKGGYSWNEKNTTLLFGLSGVSDTMKSNNPARAFNGRLSGLTVSSGLSQVLSPTLVLGLGYQFVYLDGFLGNVYRSWLYLDGGTPNVEQPPGTRIRHNWEAQLSWYLPSTSTTIQAYGRVYYDSWELLATSPELRVYQMLGRDWVVRGRFRYYTQSSAYFAAPDGSNRYPRGWNGPTTGDPKLWNFHSQQLGLRLEFTLNGLGNTFLRAFSRTVLDVSFDRQWCTSAFGNNIMGTLGGRVPF